MARVEARDARAAARFAASVSAAIVRMYYSIDIERPRAARRSD
jgi:hypothetical protein